MAATVIAVASVTVAVASLLVLYLTLRRAEQVALVQTYLALRSRFLEIYQHLPFDHDNDPATLAMQAYWMNAYDEWFITTKLTPQFKRLWKVFYSRTLVAGLAHQVLEKELRYLLTLPEGFALYADEFVRELEALSGRDLHADARRHHDHGQSEPPAE